MKACRIDCTPGFLVFLVSYCCIDPAGSFYAFVCSVAAHEAGHYLVLRLLHVPVHRISFGLEGARMYTPNLSYGQEWKASAAGPAVNGILFLLLSERAPLWALVNFCLMAYNLLPIYPLDGGRMLRAVLCLLLPERAARWIERIVSALCLLLIIALAVYLTCVWHAGLWPVLCAGLLLVKTAGVIFVKSNFILDKAGIP